MIKLINDDCLKALKDIEDGSVDLVLIDPPYNIGKDKWDKWKTVELYVEFMREVFLELQRVLKENGSFYFFHNDFLQIVEIQNMINKETNFNYKSLITINKEEGSYIKKLFGNKNIFRNYINNVEYALFYTFQDSTGRKKVDHDVNNYKTLRDYSRELQKHIGLPMKGITNIIGRRVEHFFYHSSTQFSLPTKKTYEDLTNEFNLRDWKDFKEYEALREEYEALREEYEALREEYEALRYTFNEKKGVINCVTYNFSKDKKIKHPTVKPIELLEDIIKCSSNENDVVLDCFMGSASTGVACVNLNRSFIGIEIDKDYFDIAQNRILGDKDED